MASVKQVRRDTAKQIEAWLLPYQPDVPPDFPNDAPTANTIPAALVAAGYPIQTHVMKRMENGLVQVAVITPKDGAKPFPFTNRAASAVLFNSTPAGGVPQGVEYIEVGRSLQKIYFQVWAASDAVRDTVSEILKVQAGDAFRIRHQPDQSVTLFKYEKESDEDFDQADSVFVRNMLWVADITTTRIQEVAKITETVFNQTESPVGTVLTPPPLTVSTL